MINETVSGFVRFLALGVLLLITATRVRGQEQPLPLSFETASVKEAPAGMKATGIEFVDPSSQMPPPRGLLRMTAPIYVLLTLAYDIQEVSELTNSLDKLPPWTREKMYTINARMKEGATLEDIRGMTRTLLAERFALKVHEVITDGPVNKLILVKHDTLGPHIREHPKEEICASDANTPADKPRKDRIPQYRKCGITYERYSGGVMIVRMADVKADDLCKTLNGLAGLVGDITPRPTENGTGLKRSYDLSLGFRVAPGGTASAPPDTRDLDDYPEFSRALEAQLGMKLVKDTGKVTLFVVDNISEPQAD